MRLQRKSRSVLILLIVLLGIIFVFPVLGQGQLRASASNFIPAQNDASRNAATNSLGYVNSGAVTDQPAGTSPLTYHGGPVEQIQYAYLIFWLPSGLHYETANNPNDSRFESLIARYFTDVSNSNISQLIVQYPDDINGSPSATVVLGGAFVDTTPYPAAGTTAAPILGQDIENEVEKVISSGSLPTGVDDAYYVFTANGINVCEDSGMTMCTFGTSQQPAGFCDYHSDFSYNTFLPYALLADEPSGMAGLCQISSSVTTNFPNNDSVADSEINLASQEQVDMQTDPLLGSWYDTVTATEISNKCAGLFGPVNATSGANIVLDGHGYILQQEWSNAAGSCTLTPPETASVQVTLDPYGSSNALTTSNYFPLSYAIGKQLFTVQYVTGSVTIQTDPNTSLSIGPMSTDSNTGSEKWCLDVSCQSDVVSLGTGSSTVILSYYDILEQGVYEATSDSSQPTTFASITYTTAPSTIGFGTAEPSVSLPLVGYTQDIWVQRYTDANVSSQFYLGSPDSQRWINPAAGWNISQPFQIPPTISYHQYLMNFSYSVAPMSTATLVGPSVSFVSNGLSNSTVAPSSVWADAGSSYSFGSQLGSSSTSQRWVSSAGTGSGNVIASASVSDEYYEQYSVSVAYNSIGSSTSGAVVPTFTGYSFGSTLTVPLSTSSKSYWLDANSNYSVSSLLPGSNSTDRWITIQNSTGIVNGQLSLDLSYYHQYALNISYSIMGGGAPQTLPIVNYTSLNSTLGIQLSNVSSPVWVNAGSVLSVSSAMASANSTERWAYNSQSQVASAPGVFEITLYHQYEIGFLVIIEGGGSPTTQPDVSAVSFGHPITIPTTTVAAVNETVGSNSTNSTGPAVYMWLDAGTSYSLPSSLGSTSTERWLTLSNPTGVSNTSEVISVKYYNQYPISLIYSVTNGADPSGSPSASVTFFGNTESVVVNQSSGQVWADAGTQVSLPAQLPGSNSGERWATNSTVTGVVTSGLTLSPSYDHQFMVTLASNPPAIPVVISQSSGWYDSGSSLVVQLIAGKGWNFESWTGQGIGAYSGTLSSLVLTVSSPLTETANFYTALTITAPSTGSVSYSFANTTGTIGQGQSKIVYVPPGQVLSMSAQPLPVLYAFSAWSGNITGGPNATTVAQNPLTFSVNSPSALAVSFRINLLGIIIVAVVVVVAVVSVLMLRRRNRPPQDEYAEEAETDTLETIEGPESS